MFAVFLPVVLLWIYNIIGLSICYEISNYFVTSPYYKNYRMITATPNVFELQYITKEYCQGSLSWATTSCSTLCGNNQSCLAFNIYESEDFYVCELLPGNLCQLSPSLVFIDWPGSSVWDKVTLGRSQSCFEIKYPSTSSIPCSNLRPGCLGTWPNCSNCVRNCFECMQRYSYTGYSACSFWPEGDAPYSKPISGLCFNNATFLIRRSVSESNGEVRNDYRMSFEDTNRIIRLGIYTSLEFYFFNSRTSRNYKYQNPYIDARGTLSNLTFLSGTSNVDILQLNGQKLKATPFITVTDDILGCGSFWLFDATTGMSCPGGRIGMLGTPKVVNQTILGQLVTIVITTGMHIDLTTYSYSSLVLFP